MVTLGYEPKLLGTSPGEIAWHLYDNYRDILSGTRHELINAVDMIYMNEHSGERWTKTWNALGKRFPQVLADFYHTCLCVAFNRLDPKQVEALKQVRIESTNPAEIPLHLAPPYEFVTMTRDVALDRDKKAHPLALIVPDGGRRDFAHGFAIGSALECKVSYLLPAGVFDTFTGWVGLHPDLARSGKPGKIMIDVLFNAKSVMRAGPLDAASTAQSIRIPVFEGGKLELISRDATGDPTTAANIVVWADTVLNRSEKAPVGVKAP